MTTTRKFPTTTFEKIMVVRDDVERATRMFDATHLRACAHQLLELADDLAKEAEEDD